ncbi:superoxide dismutase family protein [Streptomyces sp. TS71-3]|uniref:superoxide dismutase family protein n=1 Tax=Streptomyces sp. TS71-3 TaxID=2733862 RepID=UPI0035ABFA7F
MLAGAMAAVLAAASGVPAGGGGGTSGGDSFELRTVAHFSPPSGTVPSNALTYDRNLVPPGTRIEVQQNSDRRGTTVSLHVSGVRAGHAFGVHVHTKPCAADPAAAGGHYQNRVDPVQPSTDPAYVNAQNEVWLDFTADTRGKGEARAHHTWGFRSGQARSVVLHDEPGTKGARVACLTVPFGAVGGG